METLKLKLVKTIEYELKPFGRFSFKWYPNKGVNAKPNNISIGEVEFDWSKGMPYTKEDEDAFCKYMIKSKSDVLIDVEDGKFYSRSSDSWVEIKHQKLSNYKKFLSQRDYEDSNSLEAWNDYLQK